MSKYANLSDKEKVEFLEKRLWCSANDSALLMGNPMFRYDPEIVNETKEKDINKDVKKLFPKRNIRSLAIEIFERNFTDSRNYPWPECKKVTKAIEKEFYDYKKARKG